MSLMVIPVKVIVDEFDGGPSQFFLWMSLTVTPVNVIVGEFGGGPSRCHYG